MRVVILVMLSFYSLFSQADEQLSQAKAAFERYAPSFRFHDYATAFGDLNGDGVTDFATFLGDPHYTDRGEENLKIAVFLGVKDNTFSFYDVSSEIFGHSRAAHNLEIRKQSIFLHRDGSGGCCSHWVEAFQFKMHDGHLMLIGFELANYHPDDVADVDTGVSVNLLTHQIISWTGIDKNRIEKKRVQLSLKPVLLRDFNYEFLSDNWDAAP